MFTTREVRDVSNYFATYLDIREPTHCKLFDGRISKLVRFNIRDKGLLDWNNLEQHLQTHKPFELFSLDDMYVPLCSGDANPTPDYHGWLHIKWRSQYTPKQALQRSARVVSPGLRRVEGVTRSHHNNKRQGILSWVWSKLRGNKSPAAPVVLDEKEEQEQDQKDVVLKEFNLVPWEHLVDCTPSEASGLMKLLSFLCTVHGSSTSATMGMHVVREPPEATSDKTTVFRVCVSMDPAFRHATFVKIQRAYPGVRVVLNICEGQWYVYWSLFSPLLRPPVADT
jgi:hypothetical protein